MPGIGGMEFLDYIREHDPDLICVMITGYATVNLARQLRPGAEAKGLGFESEIRASTVGAWQRRRPGSSRG